LVAEEAVVVEAAGHLMEVAVFPEVPSQEAAAGHLMVVVAVEEVL